MIQRFDARIGLSSVDLTADKWLWLIDINALPAPKYPGTLDHSHTLAKA